MVWRTLLMMPSAMAFFESLPFSLSFARNGVVNAGLDDQVGQGQLAQFTQCRLLGRPECRCSGGAACRPRRA